MIYQRHVDWSLVFPVGVVGFNLKSFASFQRPLWPSSYACWANFDISSRSWIRLYLCSLMHKKETPCRLQRIRLHISGRPSEQSTELGYPSHLDSNCSSRNEKTTVQSNVDMWESRVFMLVLCREFVSLLMAYILKVYWPSNNAKTMVIGLMYVEFLIVFSRLP
jgi:hypothetical protein